MSTGTSTSVPPISQTKPKRQKWKIVLVVSVVIIVVVASGLLFYWLSRPSQIIWDRTYGGMGNDYAKSMVQTTDGGYALAGYTDSFGAGASDFWLVKTDSVGIMQWNKTYGGIANDAAYSVVQTSDGGYALAGYTYSFGAGEADFWLIKTDSHGNVQWNRTYGGTRGDDALSMIETSDGGYVLAGDTYSFGAGASDCWLVKTDASGYAEWNKTYGGTLMDQAFALTQTTDDGYALAGRTDSYGAGLGDFWLIKTDSAGDQQWNKTYGGTNYEQASSVIQTSDGGYALLGDTYSFGAGAVNFWLVKTDSAGDQQWNKTYGGTRSDVGESMVQASDGGYALAGRRTSNTAGGVDFWLIKTDSVGTVQWDETFGGTNADWAHSVIQTNDGEYALAGDTASFGAGGADFWLIKTGV